MNRNKGFVNTEMSPIERRNLSPRTELVQITPTMAGEMLKRNTGNRIVRRKAVEFLMEAIKEGRWKVTHQGIAFDRDGVLIDGQHRLLAILESGKTLPCFVSEGLDHSAKDAIDIHVRRTMYDVVTLSPEPVTNQLVCRILRGYAILTQRSDRGRSLSRNPDWFRQTFERYAPALLWVADAVRGGQRILARQDVCAAMFGYRHAHPLHAEEFWSQFATGENLKRGSPALHARNLFLGGLAFRNSSTDATHYWKLTRAQQAHHRDEEVDKLYTASVDWLGNKNVAEAETRTKKAQRAAAARNATGKP